MGSAVSYDSHGGVANIVLSADHNRNALSQQLRCELREALEDASSSAAVRAIVLTHSGPAFCSGADLTESRTDDPPGTATLVDLLIGIRTCQKPVIAALNGPARAGGLGLVAASDFAVVASDVTFAFTEVRIGVVPAVISAVVLPLLSDRWASDLLLTGRTFTADEAVAAGLVTRTTAPQGALGAAAELAAELLLAGPEAVGATKALLRSQPPEESLRGNLQALMSLSQRYFASDEAREGIRAFAERRRPSWAPEADPGGVDGSA